MSDYLIPARPARIEMRVVNSRFIASGSPAFTVEGAQDFIAQTRQEFADASHNVPLYLIGHGSSVIAHSSDDGEPSGTAGRPALAVLRGSGLGDVVAVVTRYFGGTKLGTGGLVRAYGDSVRELLKVLPRARRVPCHTVLMAVPYPLYEQTERLVATHRGQIIDADFAVDVTLTARFAVEHFDPFQEALRELSRGTCEAVVMETADVILPVRARPVDAGTA
jgi:uncharacterized YigZ family protein